MKDSPNNVVPVETLVELAKRARALDDSWVQRALFGYAVSNDPGLARALVMRLKLRAFVELLDPFPFDIPSEEAFEE
jgi:hypothetical protein